MDVNLLIDKISDTARNGLKHTRTATAKDLSIIHPMYLLQLVVEAICYSNLSTQEFTVAVEKWEAFRAASFASVETALAAELELWMPCERLNGGPHVSLYLRSKNFINQAMDPVKAEYYRITACYSDSVSVFNLIQSSVKCRRCRAADSPSLHLLLRCQILLSS